MRRTELISTREALGMTQRDVATAVGITESYYGMIESGVRTPRLELGLKIAALLNTDAARVFFSTSSQQIVATEGDDQQAAAAAGQ